MLTSLTHSDHYEFSMDRPIRLRAYVLASSMPFSLTGFNVFDYERLSFPGAYMLRCERHFRHRLSISREAPFFELKQRFSNSFEVGTTFSSQNSSADHLTLVPFESKFIHFVA